jgi:hypothetical protein
MVISIFFSVPARRVISMMLISSGDATNDY